jgi:hypothetical protein
LDGSCVPERASTTATDSDDSRIDNLELWVERQQPAGARLDDITAWVLEHYPEAVAAGSGDVDGAAAA